MNSAILVLATMPDEFTTAFFVDKLKDAGVKRPKSIRVFLLENGCKGRRTGWKSPGVPAGKPQTPIVTNQEL